MIKFEHEVLPSAEQMKFVIEGMRNPMNSWDKSDSFYHENGCRGVYCNPEDCLDCYEYGRQSDVEYSSLVLGENDETLMRKLVNAGEEHRKYLRMMPVYVRITAPLYWWKEFDTYKVGTVANSCSTMHKIQAKAFTLDDFSCDHLTCYGAATRHMENSTIEDERIEELDFDYMGALLGTIKSLNSARDQYLKTKDKLFWWQMIQLLPSSYNQTRNVMLNYEVLYKIYNSRKDHKLDEWKLHDVSETKYFGFCDWIGTLPYSYLITGESE